jgi:serine/threonine-protein kinase
VTEGFRWCPHCKGPHALSDRVCRATGRSLDGALQEQRQKPPVAMAGQLEGLVLDGKYKLLRQIGAGGIGRVFEAESLEHQRVVAIKLIGVNAAPETILRLEREARLVAAIKHPNICEVHDVGRMPNGMPFVVFERLFGETLAERTRGVLQLPVRVAIDLFSQMLLGLQTAHEARIIHRDLKPQNVFLADRPGDEPLVKLLDFGFAQDLAATSRITRPGNACGTVQYMSPEQLRVEPLDGRSDLFAVGIMLYEALAGRHPFAASSRIELQINILRAAPLPLRVRRPDVPQALEDLILRTLGRTPAERPASAVELQRELVSVKRSQALPSLNSDEEPVSLTEPVWLAPTSSPPS